MLKLKIVLSTVTAPASFACYRFILNKSIASIRVYRWLNAYNGNQVVVCLSRACCFVQIYLLNKTQCETRAFDSMNEMGFPSSQVDRPGCLLNCDMYRRR